MEKKGNTNLNQRKREIKMKTLPVILIGLMACIAIGISTARGQVGYSVEDLGVVKDMQSSEVVAINNQGNVAGTGYGGSESCAFKYDYINKFMEDAGGLNSRGFGISSTNMVVGDAFFGPAMEPRSHAAMFSGGVAKDLGVLKGQVYSRANGANGAGQVVGFSGPTRDSSESRAFVWTYQGMKDLGTLGGAYAQANAINEAGFITGTAQNRGYVRDDPRVYLSADRLRPGSECGTWVYWVVFPVMAWPSTPTTTSLAIPRVKLMTSAFTPSCMMARA